MFLITIGNDFPTQEHKGLDMEEVKRSAKALLDEDFAITIWDAEDLTPLLRAEGRSFTLLAHPRQTEAVPIMRFLVTGE